MEWHCWFPPMLTFGGNHSSASHTTFRPSSFFSRDLSSQAACCSGDFSLGAFFDLILSANWFGNCSYYSCCSEKYMMHITYNLIATKNLPSFQIQHIWFCEVPLEFFCQLFFGFWVSDAATDSCLSLQKKYMIRKCMYVHVGFAVLINPGYRSLS